MHLINGFMVHMSPEQVTIRTLYHRQSIVFSYVIVSDLYTFFLIVFLYIKLLHNQ
ncbi:hypothetical protein HanRHA438_Chr16g0769191 [Helianthus annuus]|nr:hypothetical protein HanRHA438_Chr16g0769191 [Helianthus annuus]